MPRRRSTPSTSPTPEPVKLVHELDPAKHVIPAAKVRGTIGAVAFAPEVAIDDDYLIFRATAPGASGPEYQVRLKMGPAADPKTYDGRKLVIDQLLSPGPTVPEVYVDLPKDHLLYPNGYALTLELGHRQNWSIPGKIYLCLPDNEKTVLAGMFEAAYPRQPGEPPGPADFPYIAGAVKLIGAPATSTVRVGYFVDESPGIFHCASVDLVVGDPANAIGSVHADYDKPRVTSLLAGDGKGQPIRYEHSKLTTGRYLTYAMLMPNGPIAWSWVTVLPGETHPIDLTIDATQTGGVDIAAPLEAVKDVKMTPADKPGYHLMDPAMFEGCADQLGLVQKIVLRKALFKNLSAGRYAVRASNGQTKFLEIVAGKTVELNFDDPLPVPPKTDPPVPPKTDPPAPTPKIEPLPDKK